ncbi:hypothetical protein [Microcoleus sp. K5-D4]
MSKNTQINSCAIVDVADTSIAGNRYLASPLTTAKSFPAIGAITIG